MVDISLSDARIAELLAMPKRIKNRNAREVADAKHWRRDYNAVGTTVDEEFTVFTRQHREMLEDFSAGLIWHPKAGEAVILMRCNGASHRHTNHIEGSAFGAGNYHVHVATERYINSGKNPEHYAEITNGYATIEGALHHLCMECNIEGIETTPESLDMFRQ
jgi:hypothetical protein